MASREELKLHRHQLYCSVADACQQGKINGSASALLSQLQAVLEAESCLSCIEEDSNAGPEGNNSTCQGQPQRPPSKQLRQQNKQRQTPVATPASKHTPAASAASSAVQLLKDELAQKLHAAVQRASPGVKAGAAASALVADLAAAQQAQAQLEDRLLAAQAALLQQKQQHKHDVNTWRLAAEQAADLAEAANQRAASCECKLADSAQQLAAQARATLKLGEELRQARGQLDGRWAG
ncbi:hypothetical protein OEZ85_009664 [Tetradesmus obliquus]|uniref:Uncharacterized protein n=1 Tax=Tetradesmus obliquus TaxID=3088 RepID=A0ABY8U9Q2_TETOB|nr:hypothetical protein OEZ85_009664 [Tetradesmus obliquus]